MYKLTHFKFNVPKSMYLLAFVYAIFTLGTTISGSILPVYLSQFSDAPFVLGLIGSAASLLALFVAIYVGEAIDQYGTKRFLLLGLFATSVLYVGYYVSPYLAVIVFIQMMIGISRELVYTPFFSMVRGAATQRRLAESFSLVQATSTLGIILGPLIGGYFALMDLKIPFLISAAAVLVSYTVMLKTREPRYVKRNVRLGFKYLKSAWNDFKNLGSEARYLSFTMFSLHAWYSAKWFIGPLLLIHLGYTTQDVGIWLSVSLIPFLLLAMPIGSFVDRNKREEIKMLVWSIIFALIPLMFLGISSGLYLYLFIIAIAIGNVVSDTVLESRMTQITPKNQYGEVTGIMESIKNLGWIAGPLLTTLFAQVLGYEYSLIPIIVMFVLAAFFLTREVK